MSIFAKAILEGKPIKLFNHGNMRRALLTWTTQSRRSCGSWIVRHSGDPE
jgi:hypothetical protein